MIIISVGNGLGNQMFQYALFYHLKKLYPHQQMKIDITCAFSSAHNGIEIDDIFSLYIEKADYGEVKKLVGYYPLRGDYPINSLISRFARKFDIKKESFLVQRDFTQYYTDFLELDTNKSYYLYGVFANYRYFQPIEKEIKELFQFKPIGDDINLRWKQKIENSNSVSIHIRRGDYIKYGYDICSLDYYKKAIDYILKEQRDVAFYFFSDDITFIKNNFHNLSNSYIVEGNYGKNSYKDMQLMSLCKHNIIANSTFSFWGAFLNNNKNKIVVAPNLPFTGCEVPFACDDWIKI